MITHEYYSFILAPVYASFLIIMLITHVGMYRVALTKSEDAKKPLKVRFAL